ncbi:MAG: ABC transporter permease, partial [Hyphomicrobiales bacterium]
MRLKIEPRQEISRVLLYVTPVLAVVLTVLSGLILFVLMGYAPGPALYSFFISPLLSIYGLSEIMVKAAPLMLIGVGLAI